MGKLFLSVILFFSFGTLAEEIRFKALEFIQEKNWTNQNGENLKLDLGVKKNYAFVLSYTQCKTLCPMMAHDLQKISKNFPELKIFIVSVKPEEDSAEKLREYLEKRKLSAEQFQFIKSNTQTTRDLTTKLGLYFSEYTDTEHFDHSTSIVFYNNSSQKIGQINLNSSLNQKSIADIKNILKTK